MRGLLDGLRSPHPLGQALPGLYLDDEFAQRFTAALDDVLAPVFCTLDNLDAYFDPRLAPADFMSWLAEWVGLALDENWPLERQRVLVAQAVELYRWQGTRRGLAAQVALYAGCEPEIIDSGGSDTSLTPGAALPKAEAPSVTVRIRVADPSSIDRTRIEAIVMANKPAHVAHHIEVVQS